MPPEGFSPPGGSSGPSGEEEAIHARPSARSRSDTAASVLVLACGALAGELLALRDKNRWPHMALRCLPAELHNRPEKIPAAVRAVLEEEQPRSWGRIFVAYADCGTGGLLDPVLQEFGVERLPGAHCYAFYRGVALFEAEHEANPACFYLTDFLARHFDSLVWRGLGLEAHPELLGDYFGHYERVVFLSQSGDPALKVRAENAAQRLGLAFEERPTGFGPFARALAGAMTPPERAGRAGRTGRTSHLPHAKRSPEGETRRRSPASEARRQGQSGETRRRA